MKAWTSAVAQYKQKEVTDQNPNLPIEPEDESITESALFYPSPLSLRIPPSSSYNPNCVLHWGLPIMVFSPRVGPGVKLGQQWYLTTKWGKKVIGKKMEITQILANHTQSFS